MKCEQIMNKYLKCERYERLPFSVLFHILFCKKCRDKVYYMTRATHFYYPKIRSRASKNNMLYLKTMEKILKNEEDNKKSIKNRFTYFVLIAWCIIGSLSLFAYMTLPSTKLGIKFMFSLGHYFTLQFLFTISSFFIIYTIVFVARNLNLLTKTFKLAK